MARLAAAEEIFRMQLIQPKNNNLVNFPILLTLANGVTDEIQEY